MLQDRQSRPSEFDIDILASKQYGIGNAKSSVIVFEPRPLLTEQGFLHPTKFYFHKLDGLAKSKS